MPLHAPGPRRERVLVYGRSNSGKSSTWMAIADWRRRTDAKFSIYLGDTDHAWDAMRPVGGEYDDIVSVTDLDINEYRRWIEWCRNVRSLVSADDWVVVDMIDKAWVGAQTYYWDQVNAAAGVDDVLADVYFKNQMAEGKGDDAMGGAYGANWGIINKYYRAFFEMVINMPCHVLCVAPASEVQKTDKVEVQAQFKVGWKPQGQKDLPHGFHSLLFLAETPSKWKMTSVRERGPINGGRELLKGADVDDFVQTYLMPVAGWRP